MKLKYCLVVSLSIITQLIAHKVYFCADSWGNIFINGRIEMNALSIWLEKGGVTAQQVSLREVLQDDFILKKDEKIVFFDQQWQRFSPKAFEKIKKFPKNQIALAIFEPTIIIPESYLQSIHDLFPTIFTFMDELVDDIKYRKICLPVLPSQITIKQVPFEQKKFLAAVFNNKNGDQFNYRYSQNIKNGKMFVVNPQVQERYSYRKEFIEWFGPKGLDLFGIGWDGAHYPFYQGKIEPAAETTSKVEKISEYKFVFAAENTSSLDGYVTEKLFDVMIAGSVPIYPNYNNVTKYISKECFIDPFDFESFDALYQYLITMSQDEYNKYLIAIKQFLLSQAACKFTMYGFHGMIQDFVLDNLWTV